MTDQASTQPLPPERDREILAVNQSMLESVMAGDWSTYASHCSNDLSCFEAETNGILAEGLNFHRFYFELPAPPTPAVPTVQVTMARPHLRWLSEDAVVLSYTRLTQALREGSAITASCCETRIWQRQQGRWLQVHVHRS
jgi:ketosteroid isomerase-like protein